jgi:DNA helicase-2/ATP-dependent DNA helicase PcrA
MVPVDAVTIGTIHSAKGLEFSAVFLADVVSRRFPSNYARRQDPLPFDGPFLQVINPAALADNANYDDERRLMYVAVTRAERFLFVTTNGGRQSQFFGEISGIVDAAGGLTNPTPALAPAHLRLGPTSYRRDLRLVTSFSDLRYYLECPHDFYLRKVLGFAPTIDQAFGYGRGVHNLMRAIHSNPQEWAAIANDRAALEARVRGLIDQGLFYLRYTIGDPLDNMKAKAVRIVADYVRKYVNELAVLHFEPEREFETLLEEEQVLVSGAIDVIRLDNPPRVTLIDFKSGDVESDTSTRLDADEMRLQVTLYGLAAKHELEYDPEQGLVRYLDEADPAKAEIQVDLGEEQLNAARRVVADVARRIRDRRFDEGPISQPRDQALESRCGECDFKEFCGRERAAAFRSRRRAAP